VLILLQDQLYLYILLSYLLIDHILSSRFIFFSCRTAG